MTISRRTAAVTNGMFIPRLSSTPVPAAETVVFEPASVVAVVAIVDISASADPGLGAAVCAIGGGDPSRSRRNTPSPSVAA